VELSGDRAIIVLLLAAFIDFLIGDPWWRIPHPVQMMGWVISRYQQLVVANREPPQKLTSAIFLYSSGVFLTVALVVGSAWVGWSLVAVSHAYHPLLGMAIESILLASCFATHSLRRAAEEVLQPLLAGDFATARSHLGIYVGRDTENLSEPEIYRAVLETVAENTVDAVTSPLFYAAVGSLLFPFGGVALALGFKAASTLDSMIGYKKPPVRELGWCGARLDDVLTWLPCRLTVVTLGLLARSPVRVWLACQKEGHLDPSPNSGWSECAYATILDVQLGGINTYGGVVKEKPRVGPPIDPITDEKVYAAIRLMRWSFLLWLAAAIFLILAT
jgi:adenosylcobinamide-phosphate synthase